MAAPNAAARPAEDSKKAEENKVDITIGTNILSNPRLTRSYLLPNNDRYILE